MGGGASTVGGRRATVGSTFRHRGHGPDGAEYRSMRQPPARKEPHAVRVNSEPFQDEGKCKAAPGPEDEGSERENTFHELQQDVHNKRKAGMSYNAIFNQLAAQTDDREEVSRRVTSSKRFTGKEKSRHSIPRRQSDNASAISRVFPGLLLGDRVAKFDSDVNHDSSRQLKAPPNLQQGEGTTTATPTLGGHPDGAAAARRRSSDEASEELFPGFVEEKRQSRESDTGQGQESAGAPACVISFGDTLPPGSSCAGDVAQHRLSESQSVSMGDTYKPLRRAQIFDKGVDASVMQDLMNVDAERDGEAPGDKDSGEGTSEGRSAGNSKGLGRTGLLQKQVSMGEKSADIVIGALQKFFFLEYDPEEVVQGGGQVGGGMAMLMRAMEREEHEAGTSLMEQGEEGHHMFVVEQGSLEVIIDDEPIREIGVGDRFGELALLYNAPRSASVRALSPCVLWSIHREVFKAVQALTASGNLIARSTHLYHVPWLRLLSTTDLSKLAACFQTAHYRDGDVVLTEGQKTDQCFLIESGEVVCTTHLHQDHNQRAKEEEQHDQDGDQDQNQDQGQQGKRGEGTCESVERLMMVSRPEKRPPNCSSGATGAPSGGAFPSSSASSSPRPGTARHSLSGTSGRRSTLSRVQARLNLGGANGMGATRSECQPHWNEDIGEVVFGKGCFLGVPVLLASAELKIDGLPGWELSAPSSSSSSASAPSKLGRQGTDGPVPDHDQQQQQGEFSALSPVHVVARGSVKIGHFDVSRFTKSVGPFAKMMGGLGSGPDMSPLKSVRDRRSVSNSGRGLALEYEKLTVHSFERMEFLGQGSFGFVTMVRKKEGAMEGAFFALKSLSKRGVVEGGQVQHIKDEKSVLEMFDHPFILRLYTTFQDPNRVYFLTELLTGGELWSVIYESSSGFGAGLPPDHTLFYSAVVVDALGYMHKKGIAYRDLKPENLIVDETGYLRIIDMGFAKQIPFFVTVGGETQMHPRSHTMCGTPEYLAPEFIFNKGHDQSADLWALGVLMFEMVEARTPFVLPGSEQDIAQLFTNIACVKKRGVDFPDGFDEKAGGGRPDYREVISGMLAFEPGDRLGNQANGMDDVKAHAMYQDVNWDRLEAKLVPAPWVPDAPAPFPEPETPNVNDVYSGDQELFASF